MNSRVQPNENLINFQNIKSPSEVDLRSNSGRRSIFERVLGFLYLVTTLRFSVYYLYLLGPYLLNDLWWPEFNATSAHPYLVDLSNKLLSTRSSGQANFTYESALSRDYSRLDSSSQISTAYGRAILFRQREDFERILPPLRAQTSSLTLVFTQYCWVDFNRTWETAHTDSRQARCDERYKKNAAVYWETSLRNVNWTLFQQGYGGVRGSFTETIAIPILRHPKGVSFLNQVSNCNGQVPPHLEAAYWRQNEMEYFQIAYQNYFVVGIVETIDIVNALGRIQKLTTKQIYAQSRGAWTTILMAWGIGNDLYLFQSYGYTLIGTDIKHPRQLLPCTDPLLIASDKCPPSVDAMYGYSDSWPIVNITHRFLGQHGSIDMLLLMPPRELVNFVLLVTNTMTSAIQTANSSLFDAMDDIIQEISISPVPNAWQNPKWKFLGGDPTCPLRTPKSFIQSPWVFDVSCDDQTPYSMLIKRFQLVFGLLAYTLRINSLSLLDAHGPNICALCPTESYFCLELLPRATRAVQLLSLHLNLSSCYHMMQEAAESVMSLNISIIQYATDGTENFLLSLSLLAKDDPFSLFGWFYLFDWTFQEREVVSFEGDVQTLVLISDCSMPSTLQNQILEIPTSASLYIWYITIYVTFLLSIVGIFATYQAIRTKFYLNGLNLFQFNRVSGCTWIGRPLLFVRGMSAIIILSTSNMDFIKTRGYSRFEIRPRGILTTFIIASEALWTTYVLQDILLLLLQRRESFAPALSCALVWLTYVCFELLYPYEATFMLDRKCNTLNLATLSFCSSGRIEIGSSQRFYTLLVVNVAIVSLVFATSKWIKLPRLFHAAPQPATEGHLLLSGAAEAFMNFSTTRSKNRCLDKCSSVLCGILSFRGFLFDIKLYLLLSPGQSSTSTSLRINTFRPLDLVLPYNELHQRTTASAILRQQKSHLKKKLLALLGCAYMAASVASSVSFIFVSQVSMANDFWWATFNATGTHAFLSTLYNNELLTSTTQETIVIDSDIAINPDIDFSKSSFTSMIPYLYNSAVLHEHASKPNHAIQGLRLMDGCQVPWITVSFCWLDFQKRWDLAATKSRQTRCRRQRTIQNGAVYLESALRNAQWPSLLACWGEALDIGIVRELQQSKLGIAWWQEVQSIGTTIEEEVQLWTRYGLVTYETSWQNYKYIGLFEDYTIENAYGQKHSMALRRTNGTFLLNTETSRKAHWSFASTLWSLMNPSSPILNCSLIRGSNRFAYTNDTTPRSMAIWNRTLSIPLVSQFESFENSIGPFGSVDLVYVARPQSLLRFVIEIKNFLYSAIRNQNTTSLNYRRLATSGQYMPISPLWGKVTPPVRCYGGNILCPDSPINISCAFGTGFLFGAQSACGVLQGEIISPTKFRSIAAAFAAGIAMKNTSESELEQRCSLVSTSTMLVCLKNMKGIVDFWQQSALITPSTRDALLNLQGLANKAQSEFRSLHVAIPQWIEMPHSGDSRVELSSYDLFDEGYPHFHFHAWHLVLEWAQLHREVVSFEGDLNQPRNFITSYISNVAGGFNPLEVPVNVAYYLRLVCIYITCVLGLVASLVVVYAMGSRLHVDGSNMFKMNRVAGIVWVGRPLLLLRSVTAICLLSTESLQLTKRDNVTFLVPIEAADGSSIIYRYFATIISSGEVSWLVFVLNDLGSIYTQQYTASYSVLCGLLVWLISAILSLVYPVVHTATVDRRCDVEATDWQLVCTGGNISIGDSSRFLLLSGVCLGATFVCYIGQRLTQPTRAPLPKTSLFLSSTAKYLFNTSQWTEFDVYHIDMASAVMNGMISLRTARGYFVFDVKTWKIVFVPIENDRSDIFKARGAAHLQYAIPLVE